MPLFEFILLLLISGTVGYYCGILLGHYIEKYSPFIVVLFFSMLVYVVLFYISTKYA